MSRLVVAKQKAQTDRHRIKSYTFLYFKHQSYTKYAIRLIANGSLNELEM
jgi:hypothetical protein